MAKLPTSLEDLLRTLANAGELTHLSIIPRSGKGPGGTVFCASYSPATAWGSGFGEDPDPVNAIIKAIQDEKFKGLVAKLRINTAALPMVIPTPLTQVDYERLAGKSIPRTTKATITDKPNTDEDEPWLRDA